ncbi:hypothetical protein, partial [Litorisediminicola beolgyonensis]
MARLALHIRRRGGFGALICRLRGGGVLFCLGRGTLAALPVETRLFFGARLCFAPTRVFKLCRACGFSLGLGALAFGGDPSGFGTLGVFRFGLCAGCRFAGCQVTGFLFLGLTRRVGFARPLCRADLFRSGGCRPAATFGVATRGFLKLPRRFGVGRRRFFRVFRSEPLGLPRLFRQPLFL